MAKKMSQISKASAADATTGVKRGEEVFHILWYDCVQGLKYKLLEEQTVASLSSVIVTVSNIPWVRSGQVRRRRFTVTSRRGILTVTQARVRFRVWFAVEVRLVATCTNVHTLALSYTHTHSLTHL